MPLMLVRVLMCTLSILELMSSTSTSRAEHTGARPFPPMILMRTEMDTARIAPVPLLARSTVLPRRPMSTLSRCSSPTVQEPWQMSSRVLNGLPIAHTKKAKQGKKGFKGSAANMSLGGGKSPALDRAVNGAVEAGIHFAVAAGNDNADSCNYSPAAAELAITVGASALDDSQSIFLQLWKVQRHLCSRSEHSFHLDWKPIRHQHHLWYLHGLPTYRWSFGLLSVSSASFRL